MKLQTRKTNGIITALSPIHHGGNEKTGASQLLRRQKFFVDGRPMELPFVSGNAVRGYLRRLAMQDILQRVDYTLKNTSLYHALFSGGVLESVKKNAGQLDLEMRKKIQEVLIPVSVYGMSYGNQVLPGKLKVNELLPLCSETKALVPSEFQKHCTHEIYSFLDHSFFTRKEEAGVSGLEKSENDPTVQMKVDIEIFIPGTKFFHGFVLVKGTDLEYSFLGHLIDLWKNLPYIGGKSSSGFGHLSINYDKTISNKLYLKFIEEHSSEIVNLLEKLGSWYD